MLNIIEAAKIRLGILEIHSRQQDGSKTSLAAERPSTQHRKKHVTELSWAFTRFGLSICLVYNVLEVIILQSAIENGKDYDWGMDIFYAGLISPAVVCYAGIACFTNCRRKEPWAKWLLYGSYVFTAVLPEVLAILKGLLIESYGYVAFVTVRIGFWYLLFSKILYPLRQEAASKSDEELAAFTMNILLKELVSVSVPLLFFSFEAVACLIEEENNENCLPTSVARQCSSTTCWPSL